MSKSETKQEETSEEQLDAVSDSSEKGTPSRIFGSSSNVVLATLPIFLSFAIISLGTLINADVFEFNFPAQLALTLYFLSALALFTHTVLTISQRSAKQIDNKFWNRQILSLGLEIPLYWSMVTLIVGTLFFIALILDKITAAGT